MEEVKVSYRIIIRKSTIGSDNRENSQEVFSQDIQGELDVRSVICSINKLVKTEDTKKTEEKKA